MKKIIFTLILTTILVETTIAQGVIRTNALFDAGLIPNVGIEVGVAKKVTIGSDFYAGWVNFENYKTQGYNLTLEMRYYFVKTFSGHHLGLTGDYYNINKVVTPALEYIGYANNGNAWGVGLLYGFMFNFSNRLSVDLNIGGEYAKTNVHPMILIHDDYVAQNRVLKDVFIPRIGVTFGCKIF